MILLANFLKVEKKIHLTSKNSLISLCISVGFLFTFAASSIGREPAVDGEAYAAGANHPHDYLERGVLPR